MPDTWSVALRNAADQPHDVARESVRIYTSEMRQEKNNKTCHFKIEEYIQSIHFILCFC